MLAHQQQAANEFRDASTRTTPAVNVSSHELTLNKQLTQALTNNQQALTYN
jgi:hypothetical protein